MDIREGKDYRGANLQRANFQEADLQGTNFEKAELAFKELTL
jgi:uncharacterized protein YjbI with pentapeptide repeats